MNRIRSRLEASQAHLSRDQLEHILQRVDENLIMSPLLHETSAAVDGGTQLPTSDLLEKIHELKQMRAPLFVVKGRDIRNQLKRLLNVPIRILSHKQIRFNRELLELLTLLVTSLHRSYQHTKDQTQHEQMLVLQQQQLQSSQQMIQRLYEQVDHQIARIDQQEQELVSLRETVALLRNQYLQTQEQDPRP